MQHDPKSVATNPRADKQRRPTRFTAIVSFVGFRALEILIFVGFGMWGTLWANPLFPVDKPILATLLFIAFFLFYAHAFLFNDWSERRQQKVNILANPRTVKTMLLLLPLAAILIFALCFSQALPFMLTLIIISVLYSSQATHFKTVPIAGSLCHFIAGIVQFLAGVAVIRLPTGADYLIANYFGLIVAAGHLHQEVEHLAHDKLIGDHTNAVHFGQRPVALCSLLLFGMGSIYLLLLSHYQLVPLSLAIATVLATLLQCIYWFKTSQTDAFAKPYRRLYRFIFAGLAIYWYYVALQNT